MPGRTTIIIARILSAYLIVTAAGFLVSSGYYADMVMTKGSDPVLINLSGMVHFLIGMTILVVHFRWRGVLEAMVSLLGVFFMLKGAFLIVLPELTLMSGGNEAQASLVAPAIGFLAYGGVVFYLGWVRYRLRSGRGARDA